MKKQFVSSALAIGAFTSLAVLFAGSPAKALTLSGGSVTDITAADIGESFNISFDGSVERTTISGLTSEAVFTLTSFMNNLVTFGVSLENTSSGGVGSRVSRLGFNTDPNIAASGSDVSGAFDILIQNGSFPNGFGAVEVCLAPTRQGTTRQGNCTGGPGGVLTGETGTFDLTLAFANSIDSLNLSNFGVRYQSITGVAAGTSGTGTGTPTPVPTPAAVLPALFGMATAAVRKKKGEEVATVEA